VDGLAGLAESIRADLTVVGPELPLTLGIADEFSRRGLRILGPNGDGARLEGSKIHAKQFLERHKIPTAGVHGIYDSAEDAIRGLGSAKWPLVLKADGLCAGKGVLVTEDARAAEDFVTAVMTRRELGLGGSRMLVEETLTGRELSFIVLVDGQSYLPLVPTRDHKRVFDNDRGPNTGGMGAYSSDDLLTADLRTTITKLIVEPTLAGLAADGCDYCGFLYFGLMLTPDGPKVLEFNCRLGDPETQAIMPRVKFDLAAAISAAVDRRLSSVVPHWENGASVCVVMASGGYPGSFETAKEIGGLDDAGTMANVNVFHSGTNMTQAKYYTCSGRVLGVAAIGADLNAARDRAYEAVSKISFEGAHYRTDIAQARVSAGAAQ
jgi:phosphoribosylamine--glycine ligase